MSWIASVTKRSEAGIDAIARRLAPTLDALARRTEPARDAVAGRLRAIPEDRLDRLTKVAALAFVGALVVFVAIYAFDRFRAPAPGIVDREIGRLETVVRADPNDIAARGQLADAYLAARRYEEAIASYDAILTTGKADKAAHFGRAKAYEGIGDLPAARADYQAVVDIGRDAEMAHVDPVLNAAYYGLGSIALALDEPAAAIEHLSAALAIKRSDADALYLLGVAYLATDDAAAAIEPLRSAVAFVPIGWPDPYRALADAYGRTGDATLVSWAAAMGDLAEGRVAAAESGLLALLDGPAALEATLGLAFLDEMRGDNVASAGWYRQALTLDPENASALMGLSRVALPDAVGSAAP